MEAGMGTIKYFLALVGTVFLAGCATLVGGEKPKDPSGGGPDSNPSAITYYENVLPVVQVKCQSCHGQGTAAFPLHTYESARPMAGLMASATSSKRMPPWPPGDACNEFHGQDQRTLSQAEIGIFEQWSAQGALEGNPENAPEPPEPVVDTLGPPDLTLDPGGEFNFNNQSENLYWCFRFDPGISSPKDIVALDVEPGNKQIVHHVIIYRQPAGAGLSTGLPGFQCNALPSGGRFVTGWVPGANPMRLPDDIGIRLALTMPW